MNNTRMEESPNGPTNVPEFGTVKDSVEFMALLEMDSYQHLKEGVKVLKKKGQTVLPSPWFRLYGNIQCSLEIAPKIIFQFFHCPRLSITFVLHANTSDVIVQ